MTFFVRHHPVFKDPVIQGPLSELRILGGQETAFQENRNNKKLKR